MDEWVSIHFLFPLKYHHNDATHKMEEQNYNDANSGTGCHWQIGHLKKYLKENKKMRSE